MSQIPEPPDRSKVLVSNKMGLYAEYERNDQLAADPIRSGNVEPVENRWFPPYGWEGGRINWRILTRRYPIIVITEPGVLDTLKPIYLPKQPKRDRITDFSAALERPGSEPEIWKQENDYDQMIVHMQGYVRIKDLPAEELIGWPLFHVPSAYLPERAMTVDAAASPSGLIQLIIRPNGAVELLNKELYAVKNLTIDLVITKYRLG